jgi:hypothetical protein
MIIGLVNVVFATLVVPRFARLPAASSTIFTRFLQAQFGIWALGLAIVGGVTLFPDQILWILGEDYANLQFEVYLMATIAVLRLIAGTIQRLNLARGYVLNPWIFIPLNIGIQVMAYTIFPPVDARQALSAGVIGTLFGPLIHTINFIVHFRNQEKQSPIPHVELDPED